VRASYLMGSRKNAKPAYSGREYFKPHSLYDFHSFLLPDSSLQSMDNFPCPLRQVSFRCNCLGTMCSYSSAVYGICQTRSQGNESFLMSQIGSLILFSPSAVKYKYNALPILAEATQEFCRLSVTFSLFSQVFRPALRDNGVR
jgi:hypothetical protein